MSDDSASDHFTLPAVVHGALTRLDAPPLSTVPAVVGWAEAHLRFGLDCGVATGPSGRGRIRHRVRVDPHTGRAHADPGTPVEAAKTDAVHLLWAQTRRGLPDCACTGPLLAHWVGPTRPGGRVPWSPPRHEEMLAVRTVMRLVTYADAGYAPLALEGWLALGATAANLRHLQAQAQSRGLTFERAARQTLDRARLWVRRRRTEPAAVSTSTDLDRAVARYLASG